MLDILIVGPSAMANSRGTFGCALAMKVKNGELDQNEITAMFNE